MTAPTPPADPIQPGDQLMDLQLGRLVTCQRVEGSSVWVRVERFCCTRRNRSQVRPAGQEEMPA